METGPDATELMPIEPPETVPVLFNVNVSQLFIPALPVPVIVPELFRLAIVPPDIKIPSEPPVILCALVKLVIIPKFNSTPVSPPVIVPLASLVNVVIVSGLSVLTPTCPPLIVFELIKLPMAPKFSIASPWLLLFEMVPELFRVSMNP